MIIRDLAPPPAAAAAPGIPSSGKLAASPPVSNEPPNLLYVNLKSGKDLLAMDNDETSDPLVKLSCAGQKHESSKKDKTLKPQWNEKVGAAYLGLVANAIDIDCITVCF